MQISHIPNVLYLIGIWWVWSLFEYSELIVMFKKQAWGDLSFVTWHVILLEVSTVVIKDWTMVGNNTQVGWGD